MRTSRSTQKMTRIHGVGILATLAVSVGVVGLTSPMPEATPAPISIGFQDTTVTLRAILLPPEELARKATAAPAAEVIGGAVTLKSGGPETSRATVQVTNAKPGSVLPWHVHRGTCDEDEGVVGPPSVYTPVHIGADGEGVVTQTLPFDPPTGGDYRADVHKSSKDQHTFAACGELQPEK
jgi:hypothetical protein